MAKAHLLECEKTSSLYEGIISTVTRYKGKVPKDYLQNRIKQIQANNPWLKAKLVSDQEQSMMFELPEIEQSDVEILTVIDIPTLLGSDKGVDDLLEQISQAKNSEKIRALFASSGLCALDQNLDLFRVLLCEAPQDDEFAVIVSMSQILGDGATYYQILNMLDIDAEVSSLPFARQQDFIRFVPDQTEPSYPDELQSHHFCKTINRNYLEQIKQEVNQRIAPDWVSTHDVFTSLYFNSLNVELAVIPVNVRRYIDYLSDTQVGNYLKPLHIRSQIGFDPSDIREALSDLAKQPHELHSGFCDLTNNQWQDEKRLQLCKKGLLASWIQFYRPLNLGSEFKHIEHGPFYPPFYTSEVTGLFDHHTILFQSDINTWKVSIRSRLAELPDFGDLFLQD